MSRKRVTATAKALGRTTHAAASRSMLLCTLIAASASRTQAQTCGSQTQSPIATDRPQVTNSSIVVPCGSLQVENGLQVTGAGGARGLDLSETVARLGVARRTELRFSLPDYSRNDVSASGANGLSDISIGMKQQVGPVHGFDLSVILALSLPTGADAISSHGCDPYLQLPWSRSVSKNWTVAGQLGTAWPTQSGRRLATGQTSIYADRQLTPALDAYVEYAGVFPRHGGPQHQIDFGTAYKLSLHQQLDAHCGFGLSSAAPGYQIGLGYSVRFQAWRSKAAH